VENQIKLCSVGDCDKPIAGRGWCHKHYKRWQINGTLTLSKTFYKDSGIVCSVEDCNKPAKIFGWCQMHYHRWYNYGDLESRVRSIEERLLNKMIPEPNSGCWLWTGATNKDGYGSIDFNGKNRKAYRVAYELLKGPIPQGLTIDHLCRVPSCINPAHLEPTTIRENILRGNGNAAINARKTICPKGHPYSPENTYLSNRKRSCKTCDKQRHADK